MFWLKGRARNASGVPVGRIPGRRSRLSLEILEARELPAAPVISYMSTEIVAGNLIVSGQVQDEVPAQVTIQISGSVGGSVTTDVAGRFVFVRPYSSLTAAVLAQASDLEGLLSGQLAVAIPPIIGDQAPFVTLSVSYGSQRTVTLFGTVYDEHPAGLTVALSGVIGNHNVTTDSNGNFTLTTQANSLGVVTAHTTDSAGHGSNTASVTLTSAPPVICGLIVEQVGENMFKISGTVSDESPGGLVVHLTSSVQQFQLNIVVNPDGSFCETVTIEDPNACGTIYAQVIDWWGLPSEIVDYEFNR